MSALRALLGDRHQQPVAVLGVVAAERVAGVDALRRGSARSRASTRRVERAPRTRARPAGRAARSTPSSAASARARSAVRCSSSSPSSTMPSPARASSGRSTPASALSACAVQMFEVAFSRRMCCSRVCSVSTKPRGRRRRASRRRSGPASGAGSASVAAKKPNDGPPKSSRLPSVWPSPTATSTPHSPGGARMPSGSGSHGADRPARRRRARPRRAPRGPRPRRGSSAAGRTTALTSSSIAAPTRRRRSRRRAAATSTTSMP